MKKILIVSSNRLGDSILSSGVIPYLKKKYPKILITFLCGPTPASLFKYSNLVDKLIEVKKKKLSSHWIVPWFLTLFNIWDCVIDFRGTGLAYFLFCKKRIIKRNKLKDKKNHIVVSISNLLSQKKLSPHIEINKKLVNQKKYLQNLKELKKRRKLIMIAPSANWIGKIWPINKFSELISSLGDMSYFKNSIFIIVGPKEEWELISSLFKSCKGNLFNLVGKTNLAEIFLIMKECNLFIGNDSGLMHLAASAKIPTVGLFGPSDTNRYHPWGNKTLAIKSSKTPEELMGRDGFDPEECGSLMNDLSVLEVKNKLKKFLKI